MFTLVILCTNGHLFLRRRDANSLRIVTLVQGTGCIVPKHVFKTDRVVRPNKWGKNGLLNIEQIKT